MKLVRFFLVLGIVALLPLTFNAKPAHAASTASGVALNANVTCSNLQLDITLTTVGATREYGLATTETATLNEFEQFTGLGNYSGTYIGYNYPASPQTEGTIIALYAYVGETPPTAADTGEFFVLFECSNTPGSNTVIDTCYGPYGSCPQTVQDYYRVDYPYLGLVQINAGAPVYPYGSPASEMQSFSLPADYDGNGYDTYVVTDVTSVNGAYWLALWIGGEDYLWVPYDSVIALSSIDGIN